MSPVRDVKPGYVVTYPNREKASSRRTKLIVAVVLVLSALLMALVTVGGWSKLEGLIPLNIAWCVTYLVIARYVMRWARGLLPIAAALGALMLTFALIAATAADGISWEDRNAPGYAGVHALFGGSGLSPSALSTLTLVIAISQVLLIVVAMRAFAQGWNIEYEVPAEQLTA